MIISVKHSVIQYLEMREYPTVPIIGYTCATE